MRIGFMRRWLDKMASASGQENAVRPGRGADEEGGEFFRKVVDATPLAIVGVDAEGRVWLWNPAAERIFGWSADEVLGRPNPLVPPERLEEFKRNLAATMRGEFIQVDGPGRVKKGGATIDMRLWAAAVTAPGGKRLGLGIIEDMTARRKAEQDAFRAQKMDTLGRLAAGLAHDFNNLLTAISTNNQMLLSRDDLSSDARKEAEAIDAATREAEDLTKRLMALGGRSGSSQETVLVNDVLAGFEKTIRRLFRGKIEIVLDLDEKAGSVRMEPAQVEQILMNLALNARDAMTDGGRLVVRSREGGPDHHVLRAGDDSGRAPCVRVEVTDTGTGMTPEVQAHLFEPFFTTKGSAGGTGLGLATVFGIVRRCNGDVSVVSEPGKGTTFTICLPRF
ncbi:MAG: PAS domain S-box protein [Nitrospirae bacterium]|nr:PAS domain S-box protein [Nitrospirota bacterium]